MLIYKLRKALNCISRRRPVHAHIARLYSPAASQPALARPSVSQTATASLLAFRKHQRYAHTGRDEAVSRALNYHQFTIRQNTVTRPRCDACMTLANRCVLHRSSSATIHQHLADAHTRRQCFSPRLPLDHWRSASVRNSLQSIASVITVLALLFSHHSVGTTVQCSLIIVSALLLRVPSVYCTISSGCQQL